MRTEKSEYHRILDTGAYPMAPGMLCALRRLMTDERILISAEDLDALVSEGLATTWVENEMRCWEVTQVGKAAWAAFNGRPN